MRPATERRLRRLADGRLEEGEQVVACRPVWYSRPVRVPWFAARYRDLAVLTDRRLMLWEVGWLTRRPRRRVLADRRFDLTGTDLGRGRIRLDHPHHPPLVLEVGRTDADREIADALLGDDRATSVDARL